MCAEEKPSRVNSFQSFNGLTYQGDTQIKQSVALSSKIHCMMRKCDMLNFASNFFLRRNTRFEISNLHDNGGRYQRIVTCIAQKWKKIKVSCGCCTLCCYIMFYLLGVAFKWSVLFHFLIPVVEAVKYVCVLYWCIHALCTYSKHKWALT